jgi:hypothetical protein
MSISIDNTTKVVAGLKEAHAFQEIGMIREPCVICISLLHSPLYFISMSNVGILSFSKGNNKL